MKQKRLYIIICIMLIFIFILSFSSAVFELKTVVINFYSQQNEKIEIANNNIFNTNYKVEKIISSGDFEYGKLMFLQQKNKYIINLERNNPYLETVNIEAVFPNKFVIKARERVAVYRIEFDDKTFLLDKDYKILEILNDYEDDDNLISICFKENNEEKSFFSFFSLSPFAFSQSQFLSENNLVFSNLILWENLKEFNLSGDISNIVINKKNGTVFVELLTKNSSYGINIVIENVLNLFEKKLKKVLNAFSTLYKNERIKTTYGELLIDDFCNCFWHNL